MTNTYRALVARKDEEYRVAFEQRSPVQLEDGQVRVAVEYSTLNYKDGLAITNTAPIASCFPLVLGIDLAGTVSESAHPAFDAGDRVVLNGYGASETLDGGYTQSATVVGEHLVKLPQPLTTRQAMAIGTAGYTAMLCVMALQQRGLVPGSGDVLVTGAAGGVGTVAVSLLSSLGFRVVASTGRPQEADFLHSLGAAEVIPRSELSERGKPLQRPRWAGVVDSVGSHTLANALSQTHYEGVVAACGLAQGADLPATVMPFILRNVCLQGVDSVQAPMAKRVEAWRRLGSELDLAALDSLSFELAFDELIKAAPRILAGEIRGRAIVPIS